MSFLWPLLSWILKHITKVFKKCLYRGAWVAQSVKRPTLDFGSGHDLRVHGIEPRVELCDDSAQPALDSLSPFLSLPLPCSRCLSLKNKH